MNFLRRKSPFPPRPAGVVDYWVVLHVVLHTPITCEDPNEKDIAGYYRCFGIRCVPDDLHRQIAAKVDDGVIDWPDSEISEIDPSSLDKDIRKAIVPISANGTWYKSGYLYYPSEQSAKS